MSIKCFLNKQIMEEVVILGRRPQPLPKLPLSILSGQQRLVYTLSVNLSTKQIAEALSITEKQVRQVYSNIRIKSAKFTNNNVHQEPRAELVNNFQINHEILPDTHPSIRDRVESNGIMKLTPFELFVTVQIRKGFSIKTISQLTGKSVHAIRKTKQRAGQKIGPYNADNKNGFITRIDTGKKQLKIDGCLIHSAMDKVGLNRDQLCSKTGISIKRMMEIEKCGIVTYDELFLLIKQLNINPYGQTEKDQLVKKLNDPNWILMIKQNSLGDVSGNRKLRENNNQSKSRYRNRVMYYGMSYRRYTSDFSKLMIEDGRNGCFPLVLNKVQKSKCRWLLKKLMLRPVYTYRYPELLHEMDDLVRRVNEDTNPNRMNQYKRRLCNLREDIAPEDGKSIYIIGKNQLHEIKRVLSEN